MPEASWEQVAAEAAALLFENGQTTEAMRLAVGSVGPGFRLAPGWGELTVLSPREPGGTRAFAEPLAVDIARVVAVGQIVDDLVARPGSPAEARARLAAVRTSAPVTLARFALMAAAGAAGLAVIFGISDWLGLLVVFVSAGLGACLRRGLSHVSSNPLLQPFAAAALAGTLAGGCIALGMPVPHRLIAVCPCMVLVPGPHVLNGTIDLVRARVPLGAARLGYAGLIVLAICSGLLGGLALWGQGLGDAGPAAAVPLAYDVVAAGVAVAAYGSFFNMPWRMLPVPVAVGMAAHATRWLLLSAGCGVAAGAFGACLLVGSVVSPLAHRLRIPFGAFAFASVVSLIPGVFLFQAASDGLALVAPHPADATARLLGFAANGATAFLVAVAMTFGLIIPKLCLDEFVARHHRAGAC